MHWDHWVQCYEFLGLFRCRNAVVNVAMLMLMNWDRRIWIKRSTESPGMKTMHGAFYSCNAIKTVMFQKSKSQMFSIDIVAMYIAFQCAKFLCLHCMHCLLQAFSVGRACIKIVRQPRNSPWGKTTPKFGLRFWTTMIKQLQKMSHCHSVRWAHTHHQFALLTELKFTI